MHRWQLSYLCIFHIIPRILLLKSILGIIFYRERMKYNRTTDGRKECYVLKKLVEFALENHSTKEIFLFRISCSNCGMKYENKPARFSKAGITPASAAKQIIYDAVYEQEFRAAKQSAIQCVAEHMNYCPICKQLVCNQCFLICDDLDMCNQCAKALNEHGSPVLAEVSV